MAQETQDLRSPVLPALVAVAFLAGVIWVLFRLYSMPVVVDGTTRVLVTLMTGYLFVLVGRSVILMLLSFADIFFNSGIKKIKTWPIVTVIIPCYNEEKVVQSAIHSVSTLNYPNLEILVVDDGSRDYTLEFANISTKSGLVRVIRQDNAGKAEALNRGVAEANGDLVLCMDADSHLHPDCLLEGVPYFEENPRLGGVGGNVVIGNPINLLTRFQKLEYIISLNFHKTAQSFLKMVTIIPGPIGLFRKKAIEAVGGYRSDTFAEDAELTVRLLIAGYGTAYCPRMVAMTEAPDSMGQLITQRYRWSRGIIQVVKRHAKALLNPFTEPKRFVIVAYVAFESVFIPVCNFVFSMAALIFALNTGRREMIGPFFVGVTLLDICLAMYSVLAERGSLQLLVLTLFNRVTYGLSMEVLRFLSMIDEVLNVPMKWGSLLRKGMKTT